MAEATALRSLSLARMEHSAEELSRLSGLGPGLQRLAVSWCSHLPAPATLAQLSGLRALHIDHTPRRGHAQEVCAELQVRRRGDAPAGGRTPGHHHLIEFAQALAGSIARPLRLQDPGVRALGAASCAR